MRKSLGQFLKEKREATAYSQADIAKAMGYSTPQFVSNWERDVSTPPMNAIKKICTLYKVNVDEVFEIVLKQEIENATTTVKKAFNRR